MEFTRRNNSDGTLDLLGSGTYGTVYPVDVTEESGKKTIAALKEMYYEYNISGFGNLREIEILCKLSRSNFIPQVIFINQDKYSYKEPDETKKVEFISIIYEISSTDGQNYFEKGKYSMLVALKLCAELLMAVDHMHIRNICHGDIKPGNILISLDGKGNPTLKLCDFGLSHFVSETEERNYNLFTYNYRDPALWWQVKNYTLSIDIWAIGVTIYEIFTGKYLLRDIRKYECLPYFEEILSAIPNEWTPKLQEIYRNNCSSEHKNLEIFGNSEIRPIAPTSRSFDSRIRSSRKFNKIEENHISSANELLLICLDFDYRKRKSSKEILKNTLFNSLRSYINKSLAFQERDQILDKINILISPEINNIKVSFFREAYEKLKRKIPIRVFFHAIDLANIYLTTYSDITIDLNNIFSGLLYHFEKFFNVLTEPNDAYIFFFKTYPEETFDEEKHRELDLFIYNFESLVIDKTKFIGFKSYRDVIYEMQDFYHHFLDTYRLEQLLFAFLEINEWTNDRTYRYMYRFLYNKLFDPNFDV